jgi:thymidylate synthase
LQHNLIYEDSRNGKVAYVDEPVTITYEEPDKQVLMSPDRDANPFFHVYEGLWMLAGKNDLDSLQHFVSNFKNYSDDGRTLSGAYGERWVSHFGANQINEVIHELERNPNSRRAVLAMWSAADLFKLSYGVKDVPCNLSIVFKIKNEKLDMTVFNRSNDLVLGCLGANYVHMTMLMCYVAACLKVPVGHYHQISSNLHIYLDHPKSEEFEVITNDYPPSTNWLLKDFEFEKRTFDRECRLFTQLVPCHFETLDLPMFDNTFLRLVAVPMYQAYHEHRNGNTLKAIDLCQEISSLDWKYACLHWLHRRAK